MARPHESRDELKDKHWEALELIEDGDLTLKKVATSVGIDYRELMRLISGDVEQAGKRAALFESEFKKIKKKKDARIDQLMTLSKELCLGQCSRIIKDIKKKGRLSKDDQGMVVKITTAVGRVQPSVKIDKLQYQYTRGLTVEELISEFKRLGAVAEGPSDSRTIQRTGTGRSRALSALDERGSESSQVPEDNRLRTDAEADGVSHESV